MCVTLHVRQRYFTLEDQSDSVTVSRYVAVGWGLPAAPPLPPRPLGQGAVTLAEVRAVACAECTGTPPAPPVA